jgi:hypothetical protein
MPRPIVSSSVVLGLSVLTPTKFARSNSPRFEHLRARTGHLFEANSPAPAGVNRTTHEGAALVHREPAALQGPASFPPRIGNPLGVVGFHEFCGPSRPLGIARETCLRSSSITIRVGLTGHARWGASLRTIHPVGNLIGLSLARSMRTPSRSFVHFSMRGQWPGAALVPRTRRSSAPQ